MLQMTEGVFVLSEKKAKKRNKKGKWGFWVIFLALFLAIIAAIVSITNSFSAVLVKICAAKVESFAMSAVNSSVSEAMNSGVKYSDIVTIEKNSSGDITLIETNSVLINSVSRETALNIETKLESIYGEKIPIPVGQLSGITFFANLGPEIFVEIAPYSKVNCVFLSEFESAGINQTRHKIFLNITAVTQLILPFETREITTSAEVLICESILVGKVPEIYLTMGNIGGNKLDLTP